MTSYKHFQQRRRLQIQRLSWNMFSKQGDSTSPSFSAISLLCWKIFQRKEELEFWSCRGYLVKHGTLNPTNFFLRNPNWAMKTLISHRESFSQWLLLCLNPIGKSCLLQFNWDASCKSRRTQLGPTNLKGKLPRNSEMDGRLPEYASNSNSQRSISQRRRNSWVEHLHRRFTFSNISSRGQSPLTAQ